MHRMDENLISILRGNWVLFHNKQTGRKLFFIPKYDYDILKRQYESLQTAQDHFVNFFFQDDQWMHVDGETYVKILCKYHAIMMDKYVPIYSYVDIEVEKMLGEIFEIMMNGEKY